MADNKQTSVNNDLYLRGSRVKSTLSTRAETEFKTGVHYLANNPGIFEIQRSNTFMFQVNFPKGYFDNDTIFKTQAQYASESANTNDVFRISVSSAFIPHFTTNPIELKRGNNTMKFAGAPTFSNGTIKFEDYIGAGTKDLLMAWQRKVYDHNTEKVGLASDYKLTGYLYECTPDYQTVRVWKLNGCWISGLSEEDYTHDSADKHNISCTIEYDWAEVDISDLVKTN